jgi:hypothetical protein
MRTWVRLCLVAFLAGPVQAEDLVLKLPPVKTSFDLDGQHLQIAAWGTLTGSSSGLFRLGLTADFSDLQQDITGLLRAQLDRSDRCGERLSVEQASLAPMPPSGNLTVHMHYERWGCAKAFGKEVAKRLVGGNGLVEVKLTLTVEASGISLTSEVQKMEADGSLGEVLRSGSMGASFREKIRNSIQSALQKGMNPKSALPPELESALTIRSAHFADSGDGRLWIDLDAEVRLSSEQIQTLSHQLHSH